MDAGFETPLERAHGRHIYTPSIGFLRLILETVCKKQHKLLMFPETQRRPRDTMAVSRQAN